MSARGRWVLLALLAAGAAGPLAGQATLVVLVRHAEKAGPSGDVALTEAGGRRAEALVGALAGMKLAGVVTTPYRRTRGTAAPVARAQGLTPIEVAAGGDVGAHAAAVLQALDALPAGSAALVVGHSNTLGPIIAALGGPVLPDLCDGEFATLFVLDRSAAPPRLVRTRYGAADPDGADRCPATP